MKEEDIEFLVFELNQLPADFPLIPVNGKRAYKQNWQEKCFSKELIEREIKRGQATGYGLALKGNNYIAIDIDGHSANEFLCLQLIEHVLEFPETVQWTSNKSPDHYSFLLSVSPKQADVLNNRVVNVKKSRLERANKSNYDEH